MGKNAKRRRMTRDRVKFLRARMSGAPMSAQLSQLAIEHGLPNRATRRKLNTPTWYRPDA